jgi:hypothetical protein
MRLLLDMVNWSFYNRSLVRRGEVILDFDVIDSWYSELENNKAFLDNLRYDIKGYFKYVHYAKYNIAVSF